MLWPAIDVIACLAALPVAFACSYLALLTLLSGRRSPPGPVARQPFFDIIVPAHNEQAVIAQTVQSLRAIEWPEHRRRIIVVADNCSDDTSKVAHQAGARVLERSHQTDRGKGFALAY